MPSRRTAEVFERLTAQAPNRIVLVDSPPALAASPAAEIASAGEGHQRSLSIEHPTGEMTVVATLGADGAVKSAAILRTARKLFDGTVFAD